MLCRAVCDPVALAAAAHLNRCCSPDVIKKGGDIVGHIRLFYDEEVAAMLFHTARSRQQLVGTKTLLESDTGMHFQVTGSDD